MENAEESSVPLRENMNARILMTIAKAGRGGGTTLTTIDFIGYERPRHAPYSLDLAPMDLSSSEI